MLPKWRRPGLPSRQPLTRAHSTAVQFEAHVALAAVSDPHGGGAPSVQTQVGEGLADVGDVLGEDEACGPQSHTDTLRPNGAIQRFQGVTL